MSREKQNVYNEILQWLEAHDGQYPRSIIIKDGKVLKVEELSPEERAERNLYARWYKSEEYKAFQACKGIPLEHLPAEYEPYREQIAILRKYEKSTFKEMIAWLETHDGQYPRGCITKDGKVLKVEELSPGEKAERNLYARWMYSEEYKAFQACKGIPLEDLLAEYEPYREQIATLRRYEKSILEEMIAWMEIHDGKYPRSVIRKDGKDGKYLKVEEMSQEERKEVQLYGRWKNSEEYKAFQACKGIPLEDLPAEYEPYREQIATLRRYEQIRKSEKEKKVYNEMIQWLEAHDGKYPRVAIIKDGKVLKVEELSPGERAERNLYARWRRTEEYKAFQACKGIPLEHLPVEYEQIGRASCRERV